KRRRYQHSISASHRRSHARRETEGRRTWLVKRDVGVWRLAMIASALLLLTWIGWSIIAQTAALSFAESHPDVALGFVADQHAALNRLAGKELLAADANLDSARERVERVLRSSPLNARALNLLGLIAERKGDQKSAETLMQIAAARTWRIQTTDEWLLN